MSSTEALAEVGGAVAAAPVTVAEPDVPIVDIPPDETISVETLADKSIGDVVKTEDAVMEDGPGVEEEKRTPVVLETVKTEVATEVIEVVTSTVITAIQEVKTETPTETSLGKREREGIENGTDDTKKLKADENGKEENAAVVPVKLGPKLFQSGIEMFTYFYDLLHGWVSNVDFNKYEHMVLHDLLTKGHRDPESKIGSGIKAFQIRFHSGWHSRCYYLVRQDGTAEDFSYRKCVDRLMPLPESLFTPSGDLIVEKLFGADGKWEKKGKGKGGADHGEREGKGHRGNKGRGSGGGWRGGKGGGGGGRGKKW